MLAFILYILKMKRFLHIRNKINILHYLVYQIPSQSCGTHLNMLKAQILEHWVKEQRQYCTWKGLTNKNALYFLDKSGY